MKTTLRGLARTADRKLCRFSPRPFTRFALITGGRTGSHLLLSLLDSHPQLRHYGEVIGESRLRQPDVKASIIQRGVTNEVAASMKRSSVFDSAVGFKLNYYQVGNEYAAKWDVPDVGQALTFLVENKDIKIIHLKRRNRLRILASKRVAAETKQYVLVDDKKRVDNVKINLSVHDCLEEFEQIEQCEMSFDKKFENHDMTQVFYEDLVCAQDRECARMLEFLGLPMKRLHARTVKLAQNSLAETIINYDALKREFAGTPYEAFFED